jgi:hypothetical protein
MVQLLNSGDIPDAGPGADKVREFVISALKYYGCVPLVSIYNKLFEWQSNNAETEESELLLGFGHVRMIVTTTKNGKQHESRIVNGPLFEVPVEAKLQEEVSGCSDILVRPEKDAKISLNDEVFSVITSAGKSNAQLIDKLHKLEKTTSVSCLNLESSDSFKPLLETAALLSCGGKFRSAKELNVHLFPQNRRNLVITDAWCLYSRRKKITAFSRDARNLIKALKSRKLDITEPIRGLLSGPDYLNDYLEHSRPVGTVNKDGLVYALPASQIQKEIGVRILVNGEPVVSVVGPPGMLFSDHGQSMPPASFSTKFCLLSFIPSRNWEDSFDRQYCGDYSFRRQERHCGLIEPESSRGFC